MALSWSEHRIAQVVKKGQGNDKKLITADAPLFSVYLPPIERELQCVQC